MPPSPRIALFTRFPTPGAAKTRLIPAVGAQGAARVHRRLVEQTIHTVRASGVAFELRHTGAVAAAFADWLGDDVPLVEQGAGDLGDRLARAAAPAILIGSDAPGLTPAHLRDAATALARADAVIGPAADGGYWLLGIARPMPSLFVDMPWGTDRVAAETLHRLAAAGIDPIRLPMLDDCDRPEDLARWPDLVA